MVALVRQNALLSNQGKAQAATRAPAASATTWLLADEPVLKEIFLRGEDVHTATASQVFGRSAEELTPMDRSKAKMINYGIVYGLSAFGLADRLAIEQEEAQEFIDRYLERFPAVAQFMADAITQAEEHGYVSTLFGRRRQIPEIRARNWQTRKLGERLAVNTIIQGTAADIIKVAMVRTHDALAAAGLATRTILQIHDELLFEGPAEEAEAATEIASAEMIGAADLDPPLVVDPGVGANWLVCLAAYLSFMGREYFSKVAGIWFPTFAFVMLAFDHVVYDTSL